jgi:hypothetical protein
VFVPAADRSAGGAAAQHRAPRNAAVFRNVDVNRLPICGSIAWDSTALHSFQR